MSEKIYLRCYYGCQAPIVEFNPETLEFKNMSLEFYKNSDYERSGICAFVTRKESKELIFVALYERNQKMYLCVGAKRYDLFDEAYSISIKRGIFKKSVTLMHGPEVVMRVSYSAVADVDDVFCYVKDILANKPRRIIRRK